MTTKHTPGEWLTTPDKTMVYALNEDGTNRFTAQIGGGWVRQHKERTSEGELQANAHLIAAAPDLLEALKKAEQQLDYGQVNAALSIIRAAIVKAEGRDV